jgi:hypothetical protein
VDVRQYDGGDGGVHDGDLQHGVDDGVRPVTLALRCVPAAAAGSQGDVSGDGGVSGDAYGDDASVDEDDRQCDGQPRQRECQSRCIRSTA